MLEEKKNRLYEIIPTSGKGKGRPFQKSRFFVGSSESCDIVLDHDGIDGIHAVIEFDHGVGRIYDMSSTLGTYVNGQKIVVADIKTGDRFKLGKSEFQIKDLKEEDLLPPTLDLLKVKAPKPPSVKAPQSFALKQNQDIDWRIEYPLTKDPKSLSSEYIFEDVETLHPVFQYQVDKIAVEVIISHRGKIHSVDFLPERDGTYHLVGHLISKETGLLEYPYLGKSERLPFVDIKGHEITVHSIFGHELQILGKATKRDQGLVSLSHDEILRFTKGDLQLFVRRTDAPPKILTPPFLRRDKLLGTFLWPLLLIVFAMTLYLQTVKVDKEIEKEKAPERLAQILKKHKPKIYVSPKQAIEKSEMAPKEIAQKSPQMEQPKPQEIKVEKKEVAPPPKKVEAKPIPNKKPAKSSPKEAKAKPAKQEPTPVQRPSPKPIQKVQTQGRVDTYKAVDFTPTMSSLLSKGGTTKNIQTESDSRAIGETSFEAGEASQNLELAKVTQDVGSLSGAVTGKIDSTKGVTGLVSKKDIFTAGLPYKTVVMGGMDPDTIRRILIEHIPQFRYCYQKQLDAAASSFHGVVKMNFDIGASGHVAKAAVEATTEGMPDDVRGCVRDVLMGIKFPAPQGGGTVEVRQPFNFYPKRT